MTRQDRAAAWLSLAAKTVCAGAGAAILLALQACSTTEMPQPKYPIYMQDKPAEATQTPTQAGDDKPAVPAPVAAATPAVTPKGEVKTADLPPPPPPPPPPSMSSSSMSSASSSSSKAPMRDESSAAAPVKDSRAAFVYVLQPHDTLYGVSRRFGVPVKDIYDLNALPPNASLRIGEKILLPPSAVDKGTDPHASGPGMVKLAAALAKAPAPISPPPPPAPVTKGGKGAKTALVPTPTAPVTPPKPETKAEAKAEAKAESSAAFDAPAPKPVVATPPAPPPGGGFPTNAELARMGKGMFEWPLKGHILVPFGQLAPNVRNDGINISATVGMEVRAAADGVVVYEGNQVKELGNTVYIKHANGWYTGYSHLDTMNVQNNQHVTKGQVIGTAGQTGVIDRPQLHFEIRYTPSTDIARPIDPNLVLP